jgi:hypothetical protein
MEMRYLYTESINGQLVGVDKSRLNADILEQVRKKYNKHAIEFFNLQLTESLTSAQINKYLENFDVLLMSTDLVPQSQSNIHLLQQHITYGYAPDFEQINKYYLPDNDKVIVYRNTKL